MKHRHNRISRKDRLISARAPRLTFVETIDNPVLNFFNEWVRHINSFIPERDKRRDNDFIDIISFGTTSRNIHTVDNLIDTSILVEFNFNPFGKI